MSNLRTREVLYESEAALRLVDHGLQGLRDDARELYSGDADDSSGTETAQLASAIGQANAELDRACAIVQDTREALASMPAAEAGGVAKRLAQATDALRASEQRLQELAEQVRQVQLQLGSNSDDVTLYR